MAKTLMKGNEAIAEAAILAGCRFYFGYPITPQNQIPEYMSKRMPQVGGTFLQAESEIAAINMVYGAAGAGVRVMTSSSSPGISLKMEGISYLAGAELPAVIVNMVRGGPGLGSIQAAQTDYFQATKGGGHGDYHMPTLAPASIQEACDLVQLAFDLADEYRTPVMLLGDGMIGQMMEPVDLIQREPRYQQKKDWATTGWEDKSRKRAVINSLYIEPEALEELNVRLQKRYAQIIENETMFEAYNTENAAIIVYAYGTVARIVKSAIKKCADLGVKVGLVRPITLWPFPVRAVYEAAAQDTVVGLLSVEMSAGQMVEDVRLAVNGIKPVDFMGKLGASLPTTEEIVEKILQVRKERG
ncbi:MAG: 3-methyl-2-oxobutanoate dehydrogenase subunit VorB [Christensenellales bacterium]|jgi:2-oxoglutarate ferredoxin oxidoreductase subunit alpha